MATAKDYIPFVGLTYAGVHSSDLGLYRVSDGSRYSDSLLPSFNDKIVDRPAADGMYFFGATMDSRTFSVDFAFDHVTEEQLKNIKLLFGAGAKKPKMLVFDEDRDYDVQPVDTSMEVLHNHNLGDGTNNETNEDIPSIKKYYLAKVAQPPEIKTLCFDEIDGENYIDIYKGELSVEFVCYSPFGYGAEKIFRGIFNKNTLVLNPSGILQKNLNEGHVEQYPIILLYRYSASAEVTVPKFNITASGGQISSIVENVSYNSRALNFNNGFKLKENIYGIIIDGEKGLVNGLTSVPTVSNDSMIGVGYTKDNVIYNGQITSGNFFSVPCGLKESYTFNTSNGALNGFNVIIFLRKRLY